jgi:hypothetical protein
MLLDVPRAIEPDTDERYTPTDLYRRCTGGSTLWLDASATRESAKCPRYYSLSERHEDGLVLPWDAPTWNNPPWSDIEPWIEKAEAEIRSRRCPLAYQLLPSWTDRKWWHRYVEPHRDGRGDGLITTRFLERERFGRPGDPEGLRSGGSPDFWCVLLVWRLPS